MLQKKKKKNSCAVKKNSEDHTGVMHTLNIEAALSITCAPAVSYNTTRLLLAFYPVLTMPSQNAAS